MSAARAASPYLHTACRDGIPRLESSAFCTLDSRSFHPVYQDEGAEDWTEFYTVRAGLALNEVRSELSCVIDIIVAITQVAVLRVEDKDDKIVTANLLYGALRFSEQAQALVETMATATPRRGAP